MREVARAQNSAVAAWQCTPEWRDSYKPSNTHLSLHLQSKMWSVVLVMTVFKQPLSLKEYFAFNWSYC